MHCINQEKDFGGSHIDALALQRENLTPQTSASQVWKVFLIVSFQIENWFPVASCSTLYLLFLSLKSQRSKENSSVSGWVQCLFYVLLSTSPSVSNYWLKDSGWSWEICRSMPINSHTVSQPLAQVRHPSGRAGEKIFRVPLGLRRGHCLELQDTLWDAGEEYFGLGQDRLWDP